MSVCVCRHALPPRMGQGSTSWPFDDRPRRAPWTRRQLPRVLESSYTDTSIWLDRIGSYSRPFEARGVCVVERHPCHTENITVIWQTHCCVLTSIVPPSLAPRHRGLHVSVLSSRHSARSRVQYALPVEVRPVRQDKEHTENVGDDRDCHFGCCLVRHAQDAGTLRQVRLFGWRGAMVSLASTSYLFERAHSSFNTIIYRLCWPLHESSRRVQFKPRLRDSSS